MSTENTSKQVVDNKLGMELILNAMLRSLEERATIKLQMYDTQEDLLIEGVIDQFDSFEGCFMVDGERFDLRYITGLG